MNAHWIWIDSEIAGENTHCAFRKHFNIVFKREVFYKLEIAADSYYRVWLNGNMIGNGPHLTADTENSADSYDIRKYLIEGDNILAVQVQYVGVTTQNYIPKRAGLCCTITDGNTGELILGTDKTWECRKLDEYKSGIPRRSWALSAYPEYLDIRESENWVRGEISRKWFRPAEIAERHFSKIIPRPIPDMKFEKVSLKNKIFSIWTCSPDSPDEKAKAEESLSAYLDKETLREAPASSFSGKKGAFVLDFSKSQGWAFCLDCGQEVTGYPYIEVESDSHGTVILAASELLQDNGDRPWLHRRHRSASKAVVAPGRNNWTSWDYSGFSYLYFSLRGFSGKVRVIDCGYISRHANFKDPEFFTGDDEINQIWDISVNAVKLCSQDLLIDCPTREQAQYWGDLVTAAPVLAYAFGDTKYFREALRQAFQAQLEDGLIVSNFPSTFDRVLYDYSLLPVIALEDYVRYTTDLAFAKEHLQDIELIVSKFESYIGNSGTLELNGKYDPTNPGDCLFLDHPGLGWHDFSYPGLERDGISAGLNFLFVLALKSAGIVSNKCGDEKAAIKYFTKAAKLLEISTDFFRNPKTGAFADVISKDRGPLGLSQQTNALAILCGAAGEDTESIINMIMDESNPNLCLCTPYFAFFLIKALIDNGHSDDALAMIKRRWGKMLEEGATTTWETFEGTAKDSLCHAWSSAPAYYLASYWAGVKIADDGEHGFASITIEPQFDALDSLSTVLNLPSGELEIAWNRKKDGVINCEITVPVKVKAVLKSDLLEDGSIDLDEGLNSFEI